MISLQDFLHSKLFIMLLWRPVLYSISLLKMKIKWLIWRKVIQGPNVVIYLGNKYTEIKSTLKKIIWNLTAQ